MNASEIEARLAELTRRNGATLVTATKEEFLALPLDPQYRFGWTAASPLTEDEDTLTITACPELIAETVEFLDDDAALGYVAVVETYVLAHLWKYGQPEHEINEAVVQCLYAAGAGDAMELSAFVRLEAFERGIVPVGGR